MDKLAIALCTCIVILYLLDAAFFNGVYFTSIISMLSELRPYFRYLMILTAERIMHSRLYGSGRHITAIRVHALFADHTIKTPNLISERPPRGDLFTLIESTTEPQLCCGALVVIGT